MITINEFNERVCTAGGSEVIEVKRGSIYRVTGAYGDGSHYYHPETNTVFRALLATEVPPLTATGHPNAEHVDVRSTALNAIGEFERDVEPTPVTVEVITAELSEVVTAFQIDPVDFERVAGVPLNEATTEAIHDYGIRYCDYDVVQDSPEGLIEYRGHDFM